MSSCSFGTREPTQDIHGMRDRDREREREDPSPVLSYDCTDRVLLAVTNLSHCLDHSQLSQGLLGARVSSQMGKIPSGVTAKSAPTSSKTKIQ